MYSMKISVPLFLLIFTSFNCRTQELGTLHSILTDIENHHYKAYKIGNQIWMGENLKTTTYNDGTPIKRVLDQRIWRNLKTGAYCWYKNDSLTYSETLEKIDYGALYNWYAVNTGKLCPIGWHVPSDEEWDELADFLGGREVAGGKMKEVGTAHWDSPNLGATNISKFTALPCGRRSGAIATSNILTFASEGGWGNWWTSTEYDQWSAIDYYVLFAREMLVTYHSGKKWGMSVRCIKDDD